jgi:hypothetical protein
VETVYECVILVGETISNGPARNDDADRRPNIGSHDRIAFWDPAVVSPNV